MTLEIKQVAIAILYQCDPNQPYGKTFLMQLRDNIPGIVYPGHWGLFGGHLELDESPLQAIQRELMEEIQHCPSQLDYVGQYCDPDVVRHVFVGMIQVPFHTLVLLEGWDMRLLTAAEIQTGQCYSSMAKEVRPVGRPHLQILNDYWEQG